MRTKLATPPSELVADSPPQPDPADVEDPVRARLLEIMELGARAERGEVVVTTLTGLSDEEIEQRLFGRMPRG